MSPSPFLACSGTSLWRDSGGHTLSWMDEERASDPIVDAILQVIR
jgi:hypothetical protein